MLRIWDRIFLIRPVLLGPAWTMVLVGHYRAPLSGSREGTDGLAAVLVLFSLLMGGIYILNQIKDVEGDRLNHKLFFLADGWVSEKSAFLQGWVMMALAMAGAIWLKWELGALFLISMALGLAYNAKWTETPVLGLAANMVGFGFLAFAVGWVAGSSAFGWKMFWCSIPYPLAIGAVYANTTVLDAKGDRRVGKNTLAVRFGCNGALWISVAIFLSASVAAWMAGDRVMLLSGGIALPFFGWMRIKKEARTIDRATKVALLALSLRMAWTYPWYLVLMGATFVGSRWYHRKRFGMHYPNLG
ncbi:MAG: UbiA family prenyltransferase [Candidatus Latescibacterota bacterium]